MLPVRNDLIFFHSGLHFHQAMKFLFLGQFTMSQFAMRVNLAWIFQIFVSWDSIIVYFKCVNVSHTFNISKGKQNFDLCQLSENLGNETKVRILNSLSGLFLITFTIKFVSNFLSSQKKIKA